jgi:hypothetical protein
LTDAVPTPHQAASVFINCPFDEAFAQQRNAIVFTCAHAGFYPIIASSSGRTGRPRLERILDALRSCRYSIHDLSRCRGEGDENLARFNMPLELGMAMAIGATGARESHEYLVLVPDKLHLHQRYVSDLAGLDPQVHDGTPERMVAEVLAWLLTAAEAPAEVAPDEVIAKLARFEESLAELDRLWQGSAPPWARIVEAAARVARED